MKDKIIEILLSENDGVEDLADRIESLYTGSVSEETIFNAKVAHSNKAKIGRSINIMREESFKAGIEWIQQQVANKTSNQSNRETALKWWNSLSLDDKQAHADAYYNCKYTMLIDSQIKEIFKRIFKMDQ